MDAALHLEQAAQAQGFLTAWASLDLPQPVQQRYQAWIGAGQHAEMDYLAQQMPTKIAPKTRFDWANSALMLGISHAYPKPPQAAGGVRLGQVARYAWVRDYHRLLAPPLSELEGLAQSLGLRAKGYVDTGPLSERSHAALGGLGWIGRNSMLMRMEEGSYLTLAVLLLESVPPGQSQLYPVRCGRCIRCVAACPTGALAGDGSLDSRLCIAYWTIEHRGLIPTQLWAGIGDWLFGCDVCQQVCPWNRKPQAFWQGFVPESELAYPNLEDCFSLSSKAFERKYAGTVFLRPGRTRMARNALVVLCNSGQREYLPLLVQASQDISPVVRATAAQALGRWGEWDQVRTLAADPHPLVAQQAQQLL